MDFDRPSTNLNVIGEAADGTRHALVVLSSMAHPGGFSHSVLVKLPDVKVDPQAITDVQHQMDAQAGVMRAQAEEIEQWKKRFDALLFAKGGAA